MRFYKSWRRSAIAAALLLLVANGAIGLILYWDSLALRQVTLEREEASLESSRDLADASLRQTLDSFVLSINAVDDALATPNFSQFSSDLKRLLMFDASARSDAFATILVIDSKGDTEWDMRMQAPPVINRGERDFFRVHKDNTGSTIFFGNPFKSDIIGEYLLPISRRIGAPDRPFSGVIVGTIRLSYILKILNRAHPSGGSAVFLREDGQILARSPFSESDIGRSLRQSLLFNYYPALRENTFQGQAAIDGVKRIFSYKKIGDYPLIVSSNGDTAKLSSTWNSQEKSIMLACLIVLFIEIFLIYSVVREIQSKSIINKDLSANSRILKSAFDSMQEALLFVDEDDDITSYNTKFLELFAISTEKLRSLRQFTTLMEYLIQKEDILRYDPLIIRKARSLSETAGEPAYERTRADGRVLNIRTLRQVDGRGYLRVYTDVTEERTAQRLLQTSNDSFQLLAEASTDVVTRMNLDYVREYVSPASLRVFGYEPWEMVGTKPADAIHPDDRTRVQHEVAELSHGAKADNRLITTYRVQHKAGHWIWVEAAMSLANNSDKGEPLAIISSLRDVSSRKSAEIALAHSESRFRLLAENTSELIMLGHDDGRRSYISPASERMLGFLPNELQKMRISDYVHPEDLQRLYDVTSSLAETHAESSLTYRALHRSKGWTWVEGRFRRIENDLPDGPTIVATFRDVSERVTQAEALRAAVDEAATARRKAEDANLAKSRFLASMSHEIRTPLHGVIGYADLLARRSDLPADAAQDVVRIQSAGSALLTIVNDVLDFSAIEAGQIRIQTKPFALEALTDNAVSIIRPTALMRGLRLDVSIDVQAQRWFNGDEDRIRQILLNLLNNAVKFTSTGSVSLSVSAVPSLAGQSRLRFEVIDTGAGIPAEKMAKLFQRFSQVDDSIRRQYGGTGLGLAICKELVGLMGGTISVQSTIGVGSRFAFELDLVAAKEPTIERLGAPPKSESLEGRILLVDDVAINQRLAAAILENAGYTVDIIGDGAAAVQAVEAHEYDVVLMDVQMPGMDGVTATRHIRALPNEKGTLPIIAMTANVLPDQVAQFRTAGMDSHIGKPFRNQELLAAVSEALRHRARSVATVFDQDVVQSLRDIMGDDQVRALLAMLKSMLNESLGDDLLLEPESLDQLAATAHMVTSAAGMLGFRELSGACCALEERCLKGDELRDVQLRVKLARAETIRTIDLLEAA